MTAHKRFERAARELWDEAMNAVCQSLQDTGMCGCENGTCVAATVYPEPHNLEMHGRAVEEAIGL